MKQSNAELVETTFLFLFFLFKKTVNERQPPDSKRKEVRGISNMNPFFRASIYSKKKGQKRIR